MEIVMGWPEWIVVFLVVVSTVGNAMYAAKQKTIEGRIGYILGSITEPFFLLGILYWGGFFS